MTPRHRHALTLLTCLLALVLRPRSGQAQMTALQFSNDGGYLNGYTGTLGWQFTLHQDVLLTAFGIYNAGLSVTTAHQVGLFALNGTLLTSGTVGPTASDTQEGYFDFAPTTPYALQGGHSYILGELLSASDYYYYDPSHITTAPSVTYVQSQYDALNTASLTFPGSAGSSSDGYGYFGPNFQFSVPEPGVLPALCVWVGGLLALRLRKRPHGAAQG